MRKLKVTEMNRLTPDEFKECEKMKLVVVLDHVRCLNNVGSVFRTADAFRVEAVYLCGITATPPHPEIHKTALGGEDSVDWRYFANTEDAVRELQSHGYFVYAIEQVEGSTKLQELFNSKFKIQNSKWTDAQFGSPASQQLSGPATRQPCAVIFGNEVKGVKQRVVDMSDGCLEIPQFGTKHSLNVSVTAGIVIWEFAKRQMLSAQ